MYRIIGEKGEWIIIHVKWAISDYQRQLMQLTLLRNVIKTIA